MRKWLALGVALVVGCPSTTIINVVASDGGAEDAGLESGPARDAGSDSSDASASCPGLVADFTAVASGTSTETVPLRYGIGQGCEYTCDAATWGYSVIDGDAPKVDGCFRYLDSGNFCCAAAACTRDDLLDSRCRSSSVGPYSWICPASDAGHIYAPQPDGSCTLSPAQATFGTNGQAFICCDVP